MSARHLPNLPSPYAEALAAALDFILTRYEVLGVVAAGTIVQGSPDPSSDLDLFVIHAHPQRQRVQRRFRGVPAEIFVNSPAAIRRYFADEVVRPCTAHMLAQGTVLVDRDPVVAELIAEAGTWLATPPNLAAAQLTQRRYAAIDALDNAQDIAEQDAENASLILHEAVRGLIETAFLAANRPLPRSKQMLPALAQLDPALGDLARRYYHADSTGARLALAAQLAQAIAQTTTFFEWETPLAVWPTHPE
jgi:hypothetical protein